MSAQPIPWRLPDSLPLVGDFVGLEDIQQLWETLARRHTRDCAPMTLPDFCVLPGTGALGLVNPGIEQIALVRQALSTPADKILCLPPTSDLAPSVVIQCCRDSRVRDAFTVPDDPALRARMLSRFREHLRCLLTPNKAPYKRMLHDVDLRPGDSCFIATPFIEPYRTEFDEGVEAAMHGLGLAVHNPGDEYRLGKKITSNILRMIRDSKIITANIRQINGNYNPNVFYELGYAQAQAQRKILIPFRHATDTEFPPIDIRDEDYFRYEDSVDLALQLYFGLRAQMSHAAVP